MSDYRCQPGCWAYKDEFDKVHALKAHVEGGDPDINKYKESVTDARLAFTRGTAGLCQLSLGRTGTRA